MKTRWIVSVIAIAVAVFILAGCGAKQPDNPAPAAGQGSGKPAPSPGGAAKPSTGGGGAYDYDYGYGAGGAAEPDESTEPDDSSGPDEDPPAGDDPPEPDDPDREVVNIEVEMTEFAFAPSSLEVPVGAKVVLTLVNRGSFTHSFSLAYPFGLKSNALGSGATETIEFIASSAGIFTFICGQPGHDAQGMVASLIVR